MEEHLTKEQTDNLFKVITSNGCREMEEVRFHQAVNEAIGISNRLKRVVSTKIAEEIRKYLYEAIPDREREDGECYDQIYSEKEEDCKIYTKKIIEIIKSNFSE